MLKMTEELRKQIDDETVNKIIYLPTFEEVQEWFLDDGGCEAACVHSCWVEPDGWCPHGRPSWLLAMGII